MTREERELAIEYLEKIKEDYIDDYGDERCPLPEYYAIEYAIKALEQEPTTKNDSVHCQHTDEEIEKSFIEDVEAVKVQLPCGQMMEFPKTFDDFARDYGFKDKNEIYTNGLELIPVFRVKQWLEHIKSSTTKNDLGVDCISRFEVTEILNSEYDIDKILDRVDELPSVTPQEPQPMVEIDLYSVIKQKYIEREVLDKIRAEIEQLRPNLRPEQMTDYDYAMVDAINDIVAIFDKYKAESEVEHE